MLISVKNFLGNMVYFNKFVRNAKAIQYLTPQEQAESEKWDFKNFVIPNGMTPREYFKRNCNPAALNAVYIKSIRRFERYFMPLRKIFVANKLISPNFYATERADNLQIAI